MKSIAWAILVSTVFVCAEYREVHGVEPDKIGPVYGPIIVILFVGFLISLVP